MDVINWNKYEKLINQNKLDYNQLIDQINYPLHYFAYHSKNNLIEIIPDEILSEFCPQTNTEGNTVCHIAGKLHNITLFNFIVSHNLDIIYETNDIGVTPLYYLVSNHKFIKKFTKENQIRDHWINSECSLLDHYILESDYDMVKYLLNYVKFGTHNIFTIINSKNTNTTDKIKLLKLYLDRNININKISERTFLSPIISATYMNDLKLVKFLLNNGAKINYFGSENIDNPLTIAIFNENDKIIKLLLDHNIKITVPNKYMQTALHYMYIYKKNILPETKYILLSECPDINLVDNQMNSILNLLIQCDDWKLYKLLLEKHKLKIYLKNKLGKSPIDYILDTDKELFYETVYKSYMNQLQSENKWIDNTDAKISKNKFNNHKAYIMNKIINDRISYPKIKKDIKTINIIDLPNVNITHFSASTYNYICFLYCILVKYPEIKLSKYAPEQFANSNLKDYYAELTKNYRTDDPADKIFRSIIREYINHSPALINHLIIWKSPEKYFFSPYIIQGIDETIKSFPETKFILFKLTIIASKNTNHANILIYDIVKNTIERFDPYGKVPFFNGEGIDQLLKSFFHDYLPNIKYIGANDLSADISFQVYSDETNDENYIENDPVGFCVAWCMWYIEMRIKNSDIEPNILIEQTIQQINKSEDKFKDYIRNYSNYLDNEKNLILEKMSVPKKYWYAKNLPKPLHELYMKNIRKLFETMLS